MNVQEFKDKSFSGLIAQVAAAGITDLRQLQSAPTRKDGVWVCTANVKAA